MRTSFLPVILLIIIATAFSSCAVVTGIFKAGMWVGVLIVVGIIALIFFVISKAGKK